MSSASAPSDPSEYQCRFNLHYYPRLNCSVNSACPVPGLDASIKATFSLFAPQDRSVSLFHTTILGNPEHRALHPYGSAYVLSLALSLSVRGPQGPWGRNRLSPGCLGLLHAQWVVLYKTQPCLSRPIPNDPSTTLMASDSSAYPLSHAAQHAAALRTVYKSPAEAIAHAWQRESEETKKLWQAADARAKERYYTPHPWSSAGRKTVGTKM